MDVIAWPSTGRPADREPLRVVLRRLQCLRGRIPCALALSPARNFEAIELVNADEDRFRFLIGEHAVDASIKGVTV